jgi:hypothetical protein
MICFQIRIVRDLPPTDSIQVSPSRLERRKISPLFSFTCSVDPEINKLMSHTTVDGRELGILSALLYPSFTLYMADRVIFPLKKSLDRFSNLRAEQQGPGMVTFVSVPRRSRSTVRQPSAHAVASPGLHAPSIPQNSSVSRCATGTEGLKERIKCFQGRIASTLCREGDWEFEA